MKSRSDLTRRAFLERAGALTGALALGACSSDLEGQGTNITTPPIPRDGGIDDNVDASPGEPVPIEEGTAAVAIVHRLDAEVAVRRAVQLAGGLPEIRPGDTVFIKTNAVHGVVAGRPGIVTSNEVIAAVVRVMRDLGAGHVTVGDRPARRHDSAPVLEATGQREAALAAGADEVYAAPRPSEDPDAWVLLQPPGFEETWAGLGGLLAMRRIVEADHFINLPVCKNHEWAVFSLSMKNLIGAIGDDSRNPMHYVRSRPDQLSRDIAILNGAFAPRLNILDARAALINGGPGGAGANAVRTLPGLVLASVDRLALDACGAALLKLELGRTPIPIPDAGHPFLVDCPPWACPQIRHGIEFGLGVDSPDKVELRFDNVADAERIEAIFRQPA